MGKGWYKMSREEKQRWLSKEWNRRGFDYIACYRINCHFCGTVFYAQHPLAKYCCYQCSIDAQIRARVERSAEARQGLTCRHCGKTFDARRGGAKYCGGACRQAAYRALR